MADWLPSELLGQEFYVLGAEQRSTRCSQIDFSDESAFLNCRQVSVRVDSVGGVDLENAIA